MKITGVSITVFRWDDIAAATYGTHIPMTRKTNRMGLLSIETDAGITGNAFIGGSFYGVDLDGHTVIESLKPIVMGQDPLNRERLYQAMKQRWRGTTWRAIGAMDIALWDIAGKSAGLPIHQLLGSYREKVRAYASSGHLKGGPPAYAEQALRLREAGYTAYKIHPPADPNECIAVCRAVRDALGKDYTIMLDPAWAFDFPQALRVGLAIQELGFYWYEDPLADDDIYNYTKLKQQLDIPLMATEATPGYFTGFAPWIIARATDYLRGDVAIKGGITSVIKGARLAEGFRMNYEVHHGGNSVNNIANLHVLMAIKNCEFFEVLLPTGAQQYAVIDDIQVGKDGYVRAFNGPGLGANIDFDLIKRKTEAVLS